MLCVCVCVCVCSECVTAANVMSEALSLSLPQSALKLLDVQKQHDVETDLGLAWDPLTSYADVMTQVLRANRFSAGPAAVDCLL